MDLVTYALVKKYAKNYTDEQVKQVIGEVFTVKGTIATVADLPTSGNRNGDIYLVMEDSSEYFYTSDGWEKFGPSINVELFMQKGVDYVTAGQKAETILGDNATAEGKDTTASGLAAHAEGRNTVASGYYSHAEGFNTIAAGQNQHVFGQYNIADNQNTYVEIVGKGDGNARSNARTLDWQGNEVLAGKLTVGAPPTGNMDVATKKYVDDITKDIDISTKANINSPAFTGTPTAPDINNPSTSSQIVTSTYLDSTIGTLDDDVEELKSKIPAEASASNQLADKEYVNTTKQDILVSGTNIKTINNQSLLGSGNIDIELGTVDTEMSDSSTNAVQNKIIKNYVDTEITEAIDLIDDKQDILVSGTNIKTINNESVLGSGNIDTTYTAGSGVDITNKVISIDTDTVVTNEYLEENYYNKTQVENLIPDVSEFITNTVDNLVNYYKKTETYNKTEVDDLLEAIATGTFVKVTTLPEASADTLHKIYLVPRTTPGSNNICDEYITVITSEDPTVTYAWELIGNTEVDLSNYYTKSEVNGLLNAKQDTLVSGTNIKTINNQSLLGSGNINTGCEVEYDDSNAWETILEAINNQQFVYCKAPIEDEGGVPKDCIALMHRIYQNDNDEINAVDFYFYEPVYDGNEIDAVSIYTVFGDPQGGAGTWEWGRKTVTHTDNTRKYAQTVQITTAIKTFIINHGLGTNDVVVNIYDVATGKDVIADITRSESNGIYTLTIDFDTTTPAGSYRVVVIG